MRVAHYLTRGETSRFYVRLRIPADMQARFGRKVVKRSTGQVFGRGAIDCALAVAAAPCMLEASQHRPSDGSGLDQCLGSVVLQGPEACVVAQLRALSRALPTSLWILPAPF